jgi:hypothetical protein
MGIKGKGRECDEYRVQWRSFGNRLMNFRDSHAVHNLAK